MRFLIAIIVFFFICLKPFAQIPDGFSYVQDEIPTIKIELRYFSTNNFIGIRINGYQKEVLILSTEATNALKNVQIALNKKGLGLKFYDAYRPQRSVNHFAAWALKVYDTLMKQQYFPNVAKENLFKEGYIAYKSGHTRGSTFDVTLINLKTGIELDMGTPYDFFGPESWVDFNKISARQKRNRKKIQKVMLKHGFKNYPKEWWHFTLKEEPFPDTYFDFVVE